jgi:serine/threonine protein kinase
VIHRDLKPSNVVLGTFGEVIVLDWGLAKTLNQPEDPAAQPVAVSAQAHTEPTMVGQVLGTPAYMAPEQAAGRLDLVDARTDIYGLGAILFEILTGRPPHGGTGVPDLLTQISQGPTPRSRSLASGVPASGMQIRYFRRYERERIEAVTALASIAPEEEATTDALIKVLKTEGSPKVQSTVITLLPTLKYGKKGASLVLALVDSPLRITSITVLASLADETTRSQMMRKLESLKYDQSPVVRNAVEKALKQLAEN